MGHLRYMFSFNFHHNPEMDEVHTVNKWGWKLNPALSDPRACLTLRPLAKGPESLEQVNEKGLGLRPETWSMY